MNIRVQGELERLWVGSDGKDDCREGWVRR